MRRFAELFRRIDQSNRSTDKAAALVDYFRCAPPADAAWALHALYGRKLTRAVPGPRVRGWLAEHTGLPAWLIDESYHAVGDFSETIALLVGADRPPADLPLHTLIEEHLLPLGRVDEAEQRRIVTRLWDTLDATQVFLFHKLLSQAFRIGVARQSVVNAMAAAAGVEPAVMAHRLLGNWKPTSADFERLLHGGDGDRDPGRPYPFMLAHPLEADPRTLGEAVQWQAEWKWDGIRAQMIRRAGQCLLWSRGEELLNESFPELVDAACALCDGCVLDGEVLAWESGRPLPFGLLQRRIHRKQRTAMLFADVPVAFMAYDLLEHEGTDLRDRPLRDRRDRLRGVVAAAGEPMLQWTDAVMLRDWAEVDAMKSEARDRGVEGVMLKRLDSAYVAGRVRGPWWKAKVDPFTVDAVLLYAQGGSGKRAGLFTDYTFGVWEGQGDERRLTPVAKAYSGLDDEEVWRVDRWVRGHTTGRSGPVRFVQPELVFELGFEGIAASDRHRGGVALRFPRMLRWRTDKKPADADHLDTLRELLDTVRRRSRGDAAG